MPPARSREPLHEQYLQARIRALRQHPEIWRAVPNGITRSMIATNAGAAASWIEVEHFLIAFGLASPNTIPYDINVPKLIRLVRELET